MIVQQFTPDDLVVVKLDIDTPATELALAEQLKNNPALQQRVDLFYFEHHVRLAQLLPIWRPRHVRGTVQDSLQLFATLRAAGIAAHSWP